jgi:polar amino acid transport system substrate-binding protein
MGANYYIYNVSWCAGEYVGVALMMNIVPDGHKVCDYDSRFFMLILRIVCLFVLVGVSFFSSLRAFSNDLKLISIDVVPWAYFDQDAKSYSGIFPDIIREIEKQTGYKIGITLTPYARINRELESGRQDCTMLIFEKERAEVTDLGELIFNMPMGVIAKKGIELRNYEDLYGLTISVLRSLDITDKFTNDKKIKKEFDTSYKNGLRKMLHGRLDAIAGAIPTITDLANLQGMSELLGERLLLSLNPVYLQCSKKSKNQNYIKKINSTLRLIRTSGGLDAIVRKYWDLD